MFLLQLVVIASISKAFDSLDHDVLMRKLRNINLANNSLNWFRSYLDRRQVVRYEDMLSDTCKFKYGIPQRSWLGPTLFIFDINGLFKHVESVKC